jgi:hypothetical protein
MTEMGDIYFQAASGLNFNPNAFITFNIALKLGFPSFDSVRYNPSRVSPVAAAISVMPLALAMAQCGGDEGSIVSGFFEAGFEIERHFFIRVQIVHDVVFFETGFHCLFLPTLRNHLCLLDVLVLSGFVTATQQHNKYFAALQKNKRSNRDHSRCAIHQCLHQPI